MSPMMWIVFPLVMFSFLVMVLVFLDVESSVWRVEETIGKKSDNVKW